MLIAICDDEQRELEAIEAALTATALELSADIEIAAYSSGAALVEAVEGGVRPALAVLDIYMGEENGVKTAGVLRGLIPGLPCAFLTTSRDFAVEAFSLDALHYIIVIHALAGEAAHSAALIRKLHDDRNIPGVCVIQMVKLGSAVKGDAGNGEGDGVRNAAFPLAVVAGDGVHVAKGEGCLCRKALEALHGQRTHMKFFDWLDHDYGPPFYAACSSVSITTS